MKNQKGITLVALVITIIVLLILAGVSISLVIGQNGVLNKATNAVSANEKATAEQEVKLAVAECQINYYDAWVKNQGVYKSDYYIGTDDTVFKYNCPGATSVTVEGLTANSNTGTATVTYTTADGSFVFYVDIANGTVSTTAPAGS